MNRTLSLWSLLILATVLVTWSCQAETVEGQFPGDCNDGADNDMDGLFDCDDETCAGSPLCEGAGDDDDTVPVGDDDTVPVGDDDTGPPPGDDDTGGPPGDDDTGGGGGGGGGGEPGESGINCQPDYCPNCEDGIDNDSDGSIDCADPDCSDFCGGGGGGGQGDDDSNGGGGQGDDDSHGGGGGGGGTEGGGEECQPASCPECEDGQDNDGDGLIDCADDGCSDWCGS